jgi:DNA-binding transcriptional LysR family regulator
MFTLRQLEVFLAVARRGHVTVAAADVHLSQSAVSAALAELAEQLGGPLFDRAGRGVVLNERGRSLVDRAAELTQRARDLAAHFLGSGTLAGRVRLGASSTIGTYLLPRLIGAFVDAHPEVQVDVEIGNSAAIEARLVEHALDAAFIEGPSHHPALEVAPWRRDALVVFAAAEHPLARRRRVAPGQLRQARWIVRESGSGTRAVFETALQAHGIQLVPHLTFGHSEAVKQAVRAGLGVGCLSRLAIELELARGEFAVLPTPALDLGRPLWQLGRRGAYVGPALQACLASLAADPRPPRRRRR